MNIQFKHILTIVLLLAFSDWTFSQTPNKFSKQDIDDFIFSINSDCVHTDTLSTMAGETIFWKRIFGFVKIRTGKGITRNFSYFCDSSLSSYQISQVEFKKKQNYHKLEFYYFKNGDLIKYDCKYYSKDNHSKQESLLHKIELYFDNKSLIHTQKIIQDDFRIKPGYIEWILNNSNQIYDDCTRAIKPSS